MLKSGRTVYNDKSKLAALSAGIIARVLLPVVTNSGSRNENVFWLWKKWNTFIADQYSIHNTVISTTQG